MTFATKITILRLLLIPVFVGFALAYVLTFSSGQSNETLRRVALAVFITAALSDWLDGWLARNCNQHSELGAFLDPIADKALVTSAILILTIFDWGSDGWSIPIWFTVLVLLRDGIILGGIYFLGTKKLKSMIKPHWSGKVSTFLLLIVLAWMMLKIVDISPVYPCAVTTVFVIGSMITYVRQGLTIMKG